MPRLLTGGMAWIRGHINIMWRTCGNGERDVVNVPPCPADPVRPSRLR